MAEPGANGEHVLGAAARTWAREKLGEAALLRAAEVVSEAGVPVVPVKGVALARWIYDDAALRAMGDIDLLVPPAALGRAREAVRKRGWEIFYEARELGELGFRADGFTIELHGFISRRELTSATVETLIARGRLDEETFGIPVVRIDDIDHFLLVVANVAKDWFITSTPHQPEDLRRLLGRLSGREREIVERARAWEFVNGLYNVVAWMAEQPQHAASFGALLAIIGPPPRPLHAAAARLARSLPHPSLYLSNAVATWSHDRFPVRARALARISRRRLWRLLGQDPG